MLKLALLWAAGAAASTVVDVAGCPRALDSRTYEAEVPAPPTVTFRPATAADVVLNTRGAVQGKDVSGQWFDLTVSRRNTDGTYAAVADDHVGDQVGQISGEYWPKVWLQFMRVRTVTPAAGTVNITRHGCGDFEPRCTSVLPPAEFGRIDAGCAAAMPPAFWVSMSREQAKHLDSRFLQWDLPSDVCANLPELGPRGLDHLRCPRGSVHAGCMDGLRRLMESRDDAFETLSDGCQEVVVQRRAQMHPVTRAVVVAEAAGRLSTAESALLAIAAVVSFCVGVHYGGQQEA